MSKVDQNIVRSNIYDCPNNKYLLAFRRKAIMSIVHFRLVDAIESLYFTNGLKKVINYKTALLFRRFFAHMWRDFLTRRQMEGIISTNMSSKWGSIDNTRTSSVWRYFSKLQRPVLMWNQDLSPIFLSERKGDAFVLKFST